MAVLDVQELEAKVRELYRVPRGVDREPGRGG